MIFVEISLEKWLEKHPDLKILNSFCNGCGSTLKTEKPFITKDFVGLTSAECQLCHNKTHKAMSFVSYDKSKISDWNDLISYL